MVLEIEPVLYLASSVVILQQCFRVYTRPSNLVANPPVYQDICVGAYQKNEYKSFHFSVYLEICCC